MKVGIVTFPETRVACLAYEGPSAREHEAVRRLVAWKLARGFTDPAKHRHYGLHHFDPVPPAGISKVDFCLSIVGPLEGEADGLVEAVIPRMRCAWARDVGSRRDNQAARHLFSQWVPSSGERPSGYPAIFHYVNVGPAVREEEAITDVYLPLG